ncbi:hypothetical protein AMTR_s00105p00071460 [Amborella trichopoda]|uniref:Uncharacterized protein n=1 Tax=Amborella trichopoda TaxID=13333 RepID=W1NWM2_AMBTC|nr:hypothetical protein AMTR_s00105p00071460 [Amborella trichopoda]
MNAKVCRGTWVMWNGCLGTPQRLVISRSIQSLEGHLADKQSLLQLYALLTQIREPYVFGKTCGWGNQTPGLSFLTLFNAAVLGSYYCKLHCVRGWSFGLDSPTTPGF